MKPIAATDVSGGPSPTFSGKVRDIYDLGDKLLLVTTDRVSAYDVIMRQPIPYKGMVLHSVSKFWFQSLGNPNHFITDDLDAIGEPFSRFPEIFRGRSMLVKKLVPIPIEAIIRGYLCGSAWNEYTKDGTVCGVALPTYMHKNQAFFKPIFTPSTKAEQGQHDENITCVEMEKRIAQWLSGLLVDKPHAGEAERVAHDLAGQIHNTSIAVYNKAASLLWGKGIIMADTKLEWGFQLDTWGPERGTPRLVLIDEAFTPDSSRFWDFRHYTLGSDIKSLDKQILRDWLDSRGPQGVMWNRLGQPPDLPQELIEKISRSYLAIHERITGHKLEVEA